MAGTNWRTAHGPIGFAFTPCPDELHHDNRVKASALQLWPLLYQYSGGTCLIEASWREIAATVGKTVSFVRSWSSALHNDGWATVEARGREGVRIVLHTSRTAHQDYRRLIVNPTDPDDEPLPEQRYAHTHARTKTPADTSPTPPVEPSANADSQPAADAENTATLLTSQQGPCEKSAGSPLENRERSTTRAYARTPENAHTRQQSNARAADESMADERKRPAASAGTPVTDGNQPPAKPRSRSKSRPLPERPVISAQLAALMNALRRRGVHVGWGALSEEDQRFMISLLHSLGPDVMAKIAASTTEAAVAAGKRRADTIRAYLRSWAQHDPTFAPEPDSPAEPGGAPWDSGPSRTRWDGTSDTTTPVQKPFGPTQHPTPTPPSYAAMRRITESITASTEQIPDTDGVRELAAQIRQTLPRREN